MDTITLHELKQLASYQAESAVSLYLSTHAFGEPERQDAIRLKNLIQSAQSQLEARGARSGDAAALLLPAEQLAGNAKFWSHRSQGLAVLVAPGLFHAYRLPQAFPESATVGRRLNIKPLLAVADRGERFLVLALSQNQVKLWEATRTAIRELAVKGLPANKREALLIDSADRGEQVHAAMRGSLGKQAAVFHGQGGEKDTAKTDIEQFFRVIDHALAPLLRHQTAPLLLAGVDYLLPIFRQVTRYPHLAERHLTGNCDLLTPLQLHERSWEVMRPYFDRPRRRALDRVRELAGTDKVSLDPAAIVTAVASGRVDVLVADAGQERYGTFDSKAGKAATCDASCAGSEDLVNLAVAETLLHGGTVFVAESRELPAQSPLAAIYRY
jgi:hypothetical protein